MNCIYEFIIKSGLPLHHALPVAGIANISKQVEVEVSPGEKGLLLKPV